MSFSDPSDSSHKHSLPSDDSSNKRQKTDSSHDDSPSAHVQVKEAIQRLHKYLLKDSKFSRSVELMVQLIRTHFRDYPEDFLCAIEEVCAERDVVHKEFKQGVLQLVNALHDKISDASPILRFRMETLHILVVLQNNLVTDDSFEFAKCCSTIDNMITSIPKDKQELTDHLFNRRLKAIMQCMRTAFKLYSTRPWSKQPVDGLYSSAAHCRLHFPIPLRDELDELITSLRNIQRKNASYTGPMNIRTFNSTAHPLRSSKYDVLR